MRAVVRLIVLACCYVCVMLCVRALSTRAKKAVVVNGPPTNWRLQWDLIGEMGQSKKGPIDEMGAEALARLHRAEFGSSQFRFQTLVATMLSPQTKDGQVFEACQNLHLLVTSKNDAAVLGPSTLAAQSLEDIEAAVRKTSFFKTKAKNLLLASQVCATRFGDDIPSNITDLLTFPGVGPKVAFLTMSIAWKVDLGICVDTHVHRITQRLGWVSPSNQPEKTRVALEAWLPQPLWGRCNDFFVRFGQTTCDAKVPKCGSCLLSPSCKHFQSITSTQVV